jgi:hypothetical protein
MVNGFQCTGQQKYKGILSLIVAGMQMNIQVLTGSELKAFANTGINLQVP